MKTDNELIARFMGQQNTWINGVDGLYKYHESWDWLMPVVGKIRTIGETSAIPNIAGRVLKDIAEFSIITDKETIYKAVVVFIKWYNSQLASQQEPSNSSGNSENL